MIDVFLVNDDVDRSSVIRAAIAANTELSLVSETQTGREGLFALATIMQGHPRIVIVRLNLGDMSGFDFIGQLKTKAPDVYVVPALEGNEGGQVWQSLLQLELRDVIVGPVPHPEITKIINSAAPRAQEKFDASRPASQTVGEAYVVSVISARGGIGKSVIAVNLAASMAKHNNSVSLLDFSLNAGDFAVMLDDVPRNNIMEAVAAGGNMDTELLQNLLAPHPRLGFRYLACPNQEFDPTPFDYNISLAMINAMRSLSEYIVIDTGLAFNGPTLAAASVSDITFFVTSRDVARLLAAQRMVKYLKNELNMAPQKLKVLINQAEIGTEISESEIESLLEHPVTAYLPSNPGPVAYSINSGAPFVIAEPQHPVSVVLNKLGELTLNRWQDKPSSSAIARKTKSLVGLIAGVGRTKSP
jgi:MinD-like ATPase involved in chromosome partitioning or flagellar assembly/CheY-like chemotaxis protein